MAAMTVGELVDFALNQAGLDTSFRTKGRQWLNYAINKMARQNNYKFLNLVAPDVVFIAGQTVYPLPTDFETTDTVYVVNNQAGSAVQGDQIFVLDSYRFDQYRRGLQGNPTLCMIDLEDGNIIFNNIPGTTTSASYRLRYFKKPNNYATNGSDDLLTPQFPDQNVLIEEVMRLAYEYLDDERYQSKKSDALEAQAKFQRNEVQNIDSNSVDLAHPNFVRRWRR